MVLQNNGKAEWDFAPHKLLSVSVNKETIFSYLEAIANADDDLAKEELENYPVSRLTEKYFETLELA